MKVAVVGAGMAGLACATALQRVNIDVMVFDKGRGPGGRMSSKRTVNGYLDMGAQYFTARDVRFKAQVQQWYEQGSVCSWSAPIYQYYAQQLTPSSDEQLRYIGVPAMHSPLQQMAQQLATNFETIISRVWSDSAGWWLQDATTKVYGPFEHVVLTLPPQQLANLLADTHSAIPTTLLRPCWAVNLELSQPTGCAAGGIFIKEPQAPVSWLAQQQTKPGRVQTENWLVHFSPDFSEQHLEAESLFFEQCAVAFLSQVLNQPLIVSHCVSHRWRYAQLALDKPAMPANPLANGLWYAGDWARGGRVENAWLSGQAIAEQIYHG